MGETNEGRHSRNDSVNIDRAAGSPTESRGAGRRVAASYEGEEMIAGPSLIEAVAGNEDTDLVEVGHILAVLRHAAVEGQT